MNENNKKAILVTGSHRSGSTWAGKMISSAQDVGYIHEPFNIKLGLNANPTTFPYNFMHICYQNESQYKEAINSILDFKYPFASNLKHSQEIKDIARIARDKCIYTGYRNKNYRPLVKDPMAFFSAEWLHERYQMDVVIMIRHPAAFCSSLKLKNWHFNFKNLTKQPLLIEQYLHPYEDQIQQYAKKEYPLIQQAILAWNCFHHTINIYQKKHPSWTFIKHEDLSKDPLAQYATIYKKLNLKFTANAKRAIIESSNANNPSEQTQNEFIRNSKENITNWNTRLTHKEIKLIKDKTGELSSLFYSKEDWSLSR